jgi:hypothetical protein
MATELPASVLDFHTRIVIVLLALLPCAATGLSACSGSAGDAGSPPGASEDGGGTAVPDGGGGADDAAPTTDAPSTPTADTGTPPDPASCPPSWTTTPACGGGSTPPGAALDFGPNVLVFDPSMTDIQSRIDAIYGKMDADQFDNLGYAYLFKPGQYNLDVQVGFYTHVIGLGTSPDDVTITGAVRAKADWLGGNNATCNFWRTVENLAVVPTQNIDNGVNIWATSQGTSIRRIHVKGALALSDNGWSSGGFVGDSKIDVKVSSGTQQQYLTRNVDLGSWDGANWNMVFVGDSQPPTGNWPQPPYTVVDATPVMREKPFLYLDANGNYLVMVPALKKNATGSSWGKDPAGSPVPPGSPLSIDLFYIAKPTDTATTINAALAKGKHLLLTPGDYKLDAPIQVTQPNTVVLGLGLPVLTATNANAVLTVADVDGVSLGGLLVEPGGTGAKTSPTLVQLGDPGSSADHSKRPTVLFDVHCRVGGNVVGSVKACMTINSNNVILENSWLWRADHAGDNVPNGWDQNMSESGLVVNGNDVTAYGLFAEHHQKFQTLWNGNGGAVYFYQSELPYDPPDQGSWMESSSINGYPSYKVADSVTTHTGKGIGIYSFFQNNVYADNAVETPSGAGVAMSHLMTFGSGTGGINNIINGTGGSATAYSNY